MARAISDAEDLGRRVGHRSYGLRVVERYADAFGVDRGRDGCWRYVPDSGGRPQRCTGQVNWAGFVATRQRRWRVWSCDGHLDGGTDWTARPR